MITADEEQIIYFFGIQSICEYVLKRLRKLNIYRYMIFFGYFSDWREKMLKMEISSSIYTWNGFRYIKAAALFIWPTTSF